MGKLKGLKSLQKTLVDGLNDLIDVKVRDEINKIKAEHSQNESTIRIKLLNDICKGENMDFNVLAKKYLKQKEICEINEDVKEEVIEDKDILSKEIINGISYYYENKDMGNVYNMNYKVVGKYKNNKIEFN